jgi:lysophospholipid acyltransferase (LPLAT)-like uncharacterized protein
LRALIPYLAYAYVTFVGLTTRLRVIGEEHLKKLTDADQRFIYAFWHQRQVFLTWTHRGTKAAVMVSRSKDGELIARTMSLSRMHSVRGSSSRGGAAAAREMFEAVQRDGFDLAFTPDGPKGPAREVKTGVLFLAQKLGIPILPLAPGLSNRLQLEKAWDKFQVPLPFGRACLVYGQPVWVREGDDLEAKAREVKAAIDRVTELADREVGRA